LSHHLLSELSEAGIIATLRAPHREAALGAVEALLAGGIRAVEVTYTTPNAGEVIAELNEKYGDSVILGAGTLTTVEQVQEAAAAGAKFFVSPGFDAEVYDAIVATGGLSMMGGFTATEVQWLAKKQVDVVKFFPGSLGGPSALKALRGPFPHLTYVPTGGVSADNIGDWLVAGAAAVGAGGELIPAAALASGDFSAISAKAVEFVKALERARNSGAAAANGAR